MAPEPESAPTTLRRNRRRKRLTRGQTGLAGVRTLVHTGHGPRQRRLTSTLRAPMSRTPSDVTQLLQCWSNGDRQALDLLMPLVYDHLRQLAHRRLRHENANLSLNTTGLVHEAYFKLVDLRSARFRDRAHFLAMASRVMRRLLIDHARARRAARRGGGAAVAELDEALALTDAQADELADLDDALQRLEQVDPRQSAIIEQRFFGGLSLEETAEVIGVSLATVKRELRFARAWLAAELSGEMAF